jgi:cell division protein ZapA
MSDSRVVHVEIHGQRYPVRSSLEQTYVAELAAYVDEKMRLAMRECPQGDSLKIAVLAALNIADEFFRARDDMASGVDSLANRAGELERMLDLALGISDSSTGSASSRASSRDEPRAAAHR